MPNQENKPKPAVSPMELVAIITCVIAALSLLWRALKTVIVPLSEKLEFLTDDGFYYLVLARNFDNLGRWTFDAGISLTSGFHPLFAYILVLLHRLFPSPEGFIQAAVVTQFLLLTLIIGAAFMIAREKRSLMLLLCFLAVMTTGSPFTASQALVEWPLALLISITTGYLIWRKPELPLPLFCGLGVLGELARSDWGLWPLSIAVSAVALRKFTNDKRTIKSALATTAGAIAGAGLVFIHSTVTTGQLAQGSALMKTHWTHVAGSGAMPILRLFGASLPGSCDNVLVQFLTLPAVCVMFLIGITIQIQQIRKQKFQTVIHAHYRDSLMVVASALTIVGYLFVYSLAGAGIAVWYTQNFIVPLTVLYAFSFEAFWLKGKNFALSLSLTMLFAMTFQSAILVKLEHGPYTWHPIVLEAARYIRDNFPNQRVAAFNAGIIGYFAGDKATVINLDGLVNNDIYQFALQDKMYDYIVSRKIEYVSDWPEQIRTLAPYCGFSDGKLVDSLKPVKSFQDTIPDEVFKNFTIYRFEPSSKSTDAPEPTKQ